MKHSSSLVFSTLCFIWGSTWLAIKVGLRTLPPFLFAGIRFAIASIVLMILVRLLHARIPRDRYSWIVMLFLGVFQISLPYGLVFWGEQYISSGLSAVLFATMSFFVLFFAHVLIRAESMTRRRILGVVAAFAGLAIIFWRDLVSAQASLFEFLGSIACVGSAVSGGLANVVAKKCASNIDPAANVFVQSIIGTILLSSMGLLTEVGIPLAWDFTSVQAVLYLGIVGSALAFVGLYWLLTKTSATNTSLIVFITPIVALILGWLMLGETLEPILALGTFLILASVYFTVK